MDLGKALVESRKPQGKRTWKPVAASMLLHGLVLAGAVAASLTATEKVAAEDKGIPVFVQHAAAAAPPPPPPPPPAKAASSATRPRVQPKQVIQPVQRSFVAPVEIPKTVPLPSAQPVDGPIEEAASELPAGPVGDVDNGVDGGVDGGVVGGELGGTIGGEVGGEQGGVVGGQIGGTVGGDINGVVGGQIGGTGTEPAPAAPAPPAPAGPVRVGGDVSAPTVVSRVDPEYTESARKARISGIVIVEAIIDKQGNVDQVKVVRGLPMGLSESAQTAVRRWKFKPGRRGGQPVDVIFNLTVVFRLGADGPSISAAPKKKDPQPAPSAPSIPEPAPEPPAEDPSTPPS